MGLELAFLHELIGTGTAFHMWATFIVILGAIAAFGYDKIPLELTSLVVLSFLLLFFHIFPLRDSHGVILLSTTHLLEGFANPALLAVLSLLVVGQAVVRTGSLNEIVTLILKLSGNRPKLAIIMSLIVVLIISAVLNNTPVVVIFIPILSAMAKKLDISVSDVMMPLSFVAILGGMTTLIGSSTNLLVSGTLKELGLQPLGFFDFFLPGSILAAIGTVYALFIVPRLLPDRASLAREMMGGVDRKFIAQIDIEAHSKLSGIQLANEYLEGFTDITVKMVQRGEHAYLAPYDGHLTLQHGDVIIVSATRAAIAELLADQPNTLLHKFPEMTEGDADSDGKIHPVEDIGMAEIVIAPASRMIGHTLEEIGFRYNYHCIVLGIQRGTRMIRSRLTEIRLAAGDVLLVLGTQESLMILRQNRDILMLEWSTEELPSRTYARRANIIFLSVVGVAALDMIPIHVSAFAGATATILFGCLNLRQAIRALDQQIILLVAASLAMSSALQATGGAAFVANSLITAMQGAHGLIVLSALFLLMALLTNILSNNASALLFTPIAVNTALLLDMHPMPFITAVILACNCSFATPVGYQTNLLVLGPGHYKFSDFLRAGIPLVLLMWVTYTLYTVFRYGGA